MWSVRGKYDCPPVSMEKVVWRGDRTGSGSSSFDKGGRGCEQEWEGLIEWGSELQWKGVA